MILKLGHNKDSIRHVPRQVASRFDWSVSMAAATKKPFSRSIPRTSCGLWGQWTAMDGNGRCKTGWWLQAIPTILVNQPPIQCFRSDAKAPGKPCDT